jgi:hypothetical protein
MYTGNMANTADIHLRVSPALKQRWEEAASRVAGGTSLTGLIRSAVEEKIKRERLDRPETRP